jgi:hypothetical protein
MDDMLIAAVTMGDAGLLASHIGRASPEQLQKAMNAAVHWSDVDCVKLLAAHCDIDNTLVYAVDRNRTQTPGLHTTPEVLSVLEAEKLRRSLAGTGRGGRRRARL